ncbi:MAG: 16S rRNA (guanine(527)-N(7))-methyltransferase RsmG [Acidobacteriota bacterium]|nr:MAG: 16S rRNA (guanine(527)-N(7))-methyltransferase RsmG [Acidobacteriota bacterium]
MQSEFAEAIKQHQTEFGVSLSDAVVERLGAYYAFILEHNPMLHLVAPSTPAEFATRHILESLTLLEFLPEGAKFADVGTGAGLPSIPCLIAREDLHAVLIESKEKKAKFLELAVEQLGLTDRVKIVNKQFQEADPGNCEYVTCRALDKFSEKLPRLLKWAMRRHLLLFGNQKLGEMLQATGLDVGPKLMPMSEQRYLFAAIR